MLTQDLSTNMRNELDKLLDKIDDSSSISNIVMKFTCPRFPDRVIRISREIESLSILQDYVNNFTDKITAELKLQKEEYLMLGEMRKNLYCELEIYYLNTSEDEPDNASPDISYLYKCVITNYEDLTKKVSAEKMLPKDRESTDYDFMELNMSIEMIADDVYKSRKQQLYGIMRGTTMGSVLLYAVNYFGFKKAMIVPPDNQRRYTNFIIPPAFGVESIMNYLQTGEGLGVYDNGFNSYITQGCWYIYPRYGRPIVRQPIHVFNLKNEAYSGMNRFDYKDGETVLILNNNGLKETNWSELGSENDMNAAAVQISDAILDGTRELVEDGKINIIRRTGQFAMIPSDPMDTTNFIKVQFMKSHGNMHTILSSLRTFQGRTMEFEWVHARPWVFQPATSVLMLYDGIGGFKSMEGACEKASFVFSRDKTHPLAPRFTCNGSITISCNNLKQKN